MAKLKAQEVENLLARFDEISNVSSYETEVCDLSDSTMGGGNFNFICTNSCG